MELALGLHPSVENKDSSGGRLFSDSLLTFTFLSCAEIVVHSSLFAGVGAKQLQITDGLPELLNSFNRRV